MNKLFEIYPKSFNKKSINSLKVFARNEGIDETDFMMRLMLNSWIWHTLWLVKKFSN